MNVMAMYEYEYGAIRIWYMSMPRSDASSIKWTCSTCSFLLRLQNTCACRAIEKHQIALQEKKIVDWNVAMVAGFRPYSIVYWVFALVGSYWVVYNTKPHNICVRCASNDYFHRCSPSVTALMNLFLPPVVIFASNASSANVRKPEAPQTRRDEEWVVTWNRFWWKCHFWPVEYFQFIGLPLAATIP